MGSNKRSTSKKCWVFLGGTKRFLPESVFLHMRQQRCSVLCFSKVPALVTWNSICVWAKGQTAKKKKETVKTPTDMCVRVAWNGVRAHPGVFSMYQCQWSFDLFGQNCKGAHEKHILGRRVQAQHLIASLTSSLFIISRRIAQQLLLRWLQSCLFSFQWLCFAVNSEREKVEWARPVCTFAERHECKAGCCQRRKHWAVGLLADRVVLALS